MKTRYYISRSYIVKELIMLVIVFGLLYLNTRPGYLSWLESISLRSEYESAYNIFIFLGPVLFGIVLYRIYMLIYKKHIKIDSLGIFDSFTFRNYGLLPWDNITAVEIQTGKRETGVMAVHLDKPVKGKYLIKINFIDISKNDVMMLSKSYLKIEESNSLALFR